MAIRTIHVGAWSRGRAHLGPMTQSPDFEPVALVDVRDDYLELGRELARLGPDACHKTLTEALERHDCDAVIVVTPVTLHAPFIDEALAAGKHVMVEKPFTVSLEDAERAVETAKAQDLQILVTQNDRLNPVYRTIARHLVEETYGPPGYAIMVHHKNRGGPYNPSPHMHAWQQGIHQLDTLLSMIPQAPTRVRGLSVEPPWGDWPSPSLIHAIIEFDGGVTASYIGTSQAKHREFQFTVECSEGALATWGYGAEATLSLKRGSDEEPLAPDPPPDGKTPEEQIAEMFHQQVSTGEPNELSGQNNLRSMKVVDAIIRATEAGGAVTIG